MKGILTITILTIMHSVTSGREKARLVQIAQNGVIVVINSRDTS